jgi:hypothetical protein
MPGSLTPHAINVRFENAPAIESVLASNLELGSVQLDARICVAKVLQMLFRSSA